MRTNSRELLVVAVATVAGLGIRALALGNLPLWLDEATTYGFARQPLSRLFGPEIAIETSPPIYYALQRFWLVFGDSRAALRSLPLLFGVLTIPASWALGRRIGGSRVGMLTAVLAASAPLFIYYSREIRGYSMLSFAVVTALACLVHLIPDQGDAADQTPQARRRQVALWAGYGAMTSLAIHSHNSAILFPVLTTFFVLLELALGRVPRRFFMPWAFVNTIVLLSFAWWLPILFDQIGGMMADFWIEKPSLSGTTDMMLGVYPYWKFAKPIMAGIGIVGLVILYRERPIWGDLAVLIVFGQPFLLLLISFYRPAFIGRAMAWTTVMYFVLAATALSQIRKPAYLAAAVALVVCIQLAATRDYYSLVYQPSAVETFEPSLELNEATDVVVIAPQILDWDYQYSMRNRAARAPVLAMSHGDREYLLADWMLSQMVARAELASGVRGYERVWVLHETQPIFPVPPAEGFEEALASLEADFRIVRKITSGRHELILYRRRTSPEAPTIF